VRNEYDSDEESVDETQTDTGIERNHWTEFSITVYNGTHSVIS